MWGEHCHPRRCPRVPKARDVDPSPHCASTHSAQPSCLTATRWAVGVPRCQGSAARRGAREASRGLPVASPPTLQSVSEPAVARALSRAPATILLQARRRFIASAGPRSPGRFRAPWQPNEAAVHPWPNEKSGQRTQSTECLVARPGHEPGRNQASAPLRCPNPAAIPRHTPTDAGMRLVDSREGTHN